MANYEWEIPQFNSENSLNKTELGMYFLGKFYSKPVT